MTRCSFCQTEHDSESGFTICPKCGAPEYEGDESSPFAVMGAPRTFKQDEKELEERYYDLSRRLHPDRFASGSPALYMKAQEVSALLNQAYLALKQPDSRLEALLKMAGLLKEGERSVGQNQIPADLAEEYFEIQEATMEDPAKAVTLVQAFRSKLLAKREALTASLHEGAAKTDWPNATTAELQALLDLRRERSYIRSMLENLTRLGVNHG